MQEEKIIPLISIIMPVYNVENYIEETLKSVQKQTYENWECICVDDASKDESVKKITKIAAKDARIKLIRLNQNSGAAVARNRGIESAKGDYLAFLDADDLWNERKLEIQLNYMVKTQALITCTSYGKIDEYSNALEKVCRCREKYTYDDVLKVCPGNSTIMYNCKQVGKVYGPDIRKRNDFAMWLKAIKATGEIYGIDDILCYHRIRRDSISINKRKLVKYQWQIYREMEKLGFFRSMYLIGYKIVQTLCDRNG